MHSRSRTLQRSALPMLVSPPLGALSFAVACDARHALTGQRRHADAAPLALDFALASSAASAGWLMLCSVKGATEHRAWSGWSGLASGAGLGLLAASRWLRRSSAPSPAAKWLSLGALMLGGAAAWHWAGRHGAGTSAEEEERGPASFPSSDEQPTLPGFRSAAASQGATTAPPAWRSGGRARLERA